VAEFCEHSNEPLVSVKDEEFLDHQHLKEDSAP